MNTLAAPLHGATAAERSAIAVAALCAVLLLPSALAAGVDTRTIDGANVWAKPIKFQLSLGLHWITVAWLLRCMAAAQRQSRTTQGAVVAGGLASLAEVLYITLQAARGRASHFNFDTAWERAMYFAFMGPAAVVIVAVTAWLGWRVWRHREAACGPGLALGAALGLMLAGVLTLVVSAPLSAGIVDGPGHWVGGPRTDAFGLPLVGWATQGGDLRVPHFVATHLLQALAVLGWAADRVAPRQATAAVWVGAVLGTALTAATLMQALAGRPFLG